MSLLANSNAIETGGYQIQRSLRFRSSASAYLSRTPASASNRTTWTWSAWQKFGNLSTSPVVFSAGLGGDTIEFNSNSLSVWLTNGSTNVTTSAVYRDPSAFYHVVVAVDTTQATASNRVKLYVNGVQVTVLSASNYPAQNYSTTFNNTVAHNIGRKQSTAYFNGYLAEVNFIDGQALTPSSFGQTDAATGVWTPKKYTGTYGTNGFYLPFSDNTSATTLAYDKSGNSNNWTANNISTTAGATYDSMTDVPTLTSATAANYCVLNPLTQYNLDGYPTAVTCYDGNLRAVGSAAQGTSSMGQSTFAVSSGKYYCEMTVLAINSANNIVLFVGVPSGGYWGFYRSGGSGQGIIGTPATYTTNDVIGLAFDAGAGSFTFYKNGVQQCVNDPAWYQAGAITNIKIQLNATGDSVAFNFGQRPFSYTPPTGFKALNTYNLPDPTIKKPNQYMDATLYTGTGSALSVTNAAGFQPDFVWVKGRSGATDHALYDAVRGTTKQLESNTTTAETTEATGLTAFNSNGFSVGALAQMNTNTATYVGWQWKESATAGFDIVTYTGTGVARTVAHSLGVAPSMIITKARNTTSSWGVYHTSLGATNYVLLDGVSASTADSTYWNNTAPTSSVFSVGTATPVNVNTNTYVAYLFKSIEGFSKFGSYSGNGSADGPFVYVGFRPLYVMLRRTDSSSGTAWFVWDAKRNTYNLLGNALRPNASNSETTTDTAFDMLSNGIKLRSSGISYNASGGTYIYAAFAENPFKYSLAR